MKIPGLYSLQSKFILGLITIIMLISIINLTALYFFMQNTLENEVRTRALIVLEQVDAVKGYVRSTLRPKMYESLPDKFVLEAMSSSFISRSVMEKIGGNNRDYLYKRVAINATNPDFEAGSTEKEIINYFRNNSEETYWEGRKEIDGQKVFVMARPVKYTIDCLTCHGDPADAPKEMTSQYGSTGYHHKEDSIDGVDLVGVATHHYTAKNDDRFVLYAVIYLTISVLLLFFIYLTFQRVVVVNLRTLTSNFRKNFSDKKGVELIDKIEHGDEIEEMIEGMENLSLHLLEADRQLKDHTANLEKEVFRRTEQLSVENVKRREDFALFVDLLRVLRTSQNRSDLWRSVLPLLVKSLKLKKASYICTFSSNQSYTWPQDKETPDLPADHITLLVEPRVRIDGKEAFIPIGANNESIEGLLYLQRQDDPPFTANDIEQLTAIGRQLGIAAENMAALGSILRQSHNLQTIVDTITDPLILMEQSGSVIMTNLAAQQLFESLPDLQENNPLSDFLEFADGEELIEAEDTREITLPDGRSFIVSTFPLLQDENSTGRVVVAITENTEKKKMVQQVVQAEKLATVGKLSAGLAHELNNPLGVILCYAELMKKNLSEDEMQSDIDVVIKHTRQAQNVLLDLLNFARPKVSTNLETVVGEVVESVVNVFKIQAAKKNVELNCHRNDGDKSVNVDQQIVEHIVLNLLINGLDAIDKAEGRIDVKTTYDSTSDSLILTIKDNGSGITAEDLPHLFDPFFTTKEINEGTGLGLSVIYGYMYELGGSIEAKNNISGGAMFTLKFPVARK